MPSRNKYTQIGPAITRESMESALDKMEEEQREVVKREAARVINEIQMINGPKKVGAHFGELSALELIAKLGLYLAGVDED